MNLKFAKPAAKYWYLLALIIIFLSAFWLRSFPARFGELQALDPFYLYRISEYVVENNFQLPETDFLRNYPFGTQPWTESFMPFYFPAIIYVLGLGWGMGYFYYALLFPAAMGALACVIIFFIGREIFNDNKAGIFAAFFLAVVPAFITRTSAGFFEKEPIAGVFSLLTILFFIKAYKNKNWKYGILSGISMFLLLQTWGGGTYFLTLISAFSLILLLLNKNIGSITKSFVPIAVISVGLMQIFPYSLALTSLSASATLTVLLILVIRNIAGKYRLFEEEKLKYIAPSILIIGFIGLLMGSMVSDDIYSITEKLVIRVTLDPGIKLSTVAESQPGSWGAITGAVSAQYSSAILPQLNFLSQYVTIWVLSIIGILLAAYRLYKNKMSDIWIIFVFIWLVTAAWSVLNFIRLLFLIGPPFVLLAGYSVSWIINKAHGLKILNKIKMKETLKLSHILIVVFIALVLTINFASAYVYSNNLGPSICFPNAGLINGKCLEIDEEGNYIYADNQPWYQAMEFLRTETDEDKSVISWWDFGYWFETRGNKSTVSDGGWSNRYDIAIWYTANIEDWDEFVPWLKDKHRVGYILQDYTLPGKYGAISKIATDGDQIVGMLQFQNSGVFPQNNKTIYEFKNGPYVIWLPLDNGNIAGAPMFMISQGGQYVQRSYINDVCTTNGILHLGDKEPSISGCVAISSMGIFYIPEEAENTIFTSLMFMEGFGLPVEKVFDNQLIKIYKVNYG